MSKLTRALRTMSTAAFVAALSLTASAATGTTNHAKTDVLVKFRSGSTVDAQLLSNLDKSGVKSEVLTDQWVRLEGPNHKLSAGTLEILKNDPQVEYIQPNYKIKLLHDFRIQDPLRRAALARALSRKAAKPNPIKDNPDIPLTNPKETAGADPLVSNQWGMIDNKVIDAWKLNQKKAKIIVAVLDTGVDYTHEDLIANMWRNPGESGKDAKGNNKENNGIDDDRNGFVDDVMGWDFAANDNKPFDLTMPPAQVLTEGGNPGHGTHCAGNVAARAGNSKGVVGVAPDAQIMALRFITEKGQGTTADAVKAIKYAVDNGARVLSNSWGSEGEDPSEATQNQALRDAIQYAQDKDVIFIAAAGNGHQGQGYDNDTDKNPAYPASYSNENIVSVAALDNSDQLGSFSNWGARTVHLGAPGVAVFSTMVNNRYSDKVVEYGGFEPTWDGTSMATPHVAGAAALYLSAHPEKTWKEVKEALLGSVHKIKSLSGKSVSGGKLDVKGLLSITN